MTLWGWPLWATLLYLAGIALPARHADAVHLSVISFLARSTCFSTPKCFFSFPGCASIPSLINMHLRVIRSKPFGRALSCLIDHGMIERRFPSKLSAGSLVFPPTGRLLPNGFVVTLFPSALRMAMAGASNMSLCVTSPTGVRHAYELREIGNAGRPAGEYDTAAHPGRSEAWIR